MRDVDIREELRERLLLPRLLFTRRTPQIRHIAKELRVHLQNASLHTTILIQARHESNAIQSGSVSLLPEG